MSEDYELSAIRLAIESPSKFAESGISPDLFGSTKLSRFAEQALTLYRQGSPLNLVEWAGSISLSRDARTLLERSEKAKESHPSAILARLRQSRLIRRARKASEALNRAIDSGVAEDIIKASWALSEATTDESQSEIVRLSDIVLETSKTILDGSKENDWIRIPYDTWRDALGKIKPGTLTVIAADTNVGKSQGALHLLCGLGESGVKVGYVSVEDERTVAGQRCIARSSGVSTEVQDSLDELEPESSGYVRSLIERGVDEKLVKRRFENILFAERVGANTSQTESAVISMAAAGARVIAVDYLQEVDSSDLGVTNRAVAVSRMVRRLKALAVSRRFALILVSQLNRVGAREALTTLAAPSIHDLKESGDIENKAEMIIMMHRDDANERVVCTLAKAKGRPNVGAEWYMARIPGMGGMLGDIGDTKVDKGE